MDNVTDPTDRQLEKTMPLLKAKLDGVHQDFKASVNGIRTILETVGGSLADVVKVLAPLSNGSALLQVKLVSGCQDATIDTTLSGENDGHSSNEHAGIEHTSAPQRLPEVANYKLSRGIHTVGQLWNEWAHGLPGGYAVKGLEEQFGTKWCGDLERRFFNRRRRIIDLVVKKATSIMASNTIEEDRAIEEAVASVEQIRITRKKTLNWISQNVNAVSHELGLQAC
jgi:hypothetical protein